MGADPSNLVDELRDAAIALDSAVWRAGLQGRFTSTRRSHSEQTRLYRAYISGRHNFPVAAPGFSAHEYGEAFDYVVAPAEYQRDVGLTWVEWGGTWGGVQDVVHFELPGASARAEQRGREQTTGLGRIRTWLDWWNDLPWYIQLILPFKTMAAEKRLSQDEMARILADVR